MRHASFGSFDGNRTAGGGLETEAHHGLVDRADLLHVERPIRDAFAIEHEKLVESTVDRAVGNERRVDALVDLARAAERAALEELEAVGVEEDAAAFGSRIVPDSAPSWIKRKSTRSCAHAP